MRGLVGIYYLVLRTVLRKKPALRRYLARCRHCWIFFIADPRNAGREDLGCPFGCAALYRRRRSTERSVAYNGTATGKAKRKQRAGARRRSGPELRESPTLGATATLEASRDADARCGGQATGGPRIDPARPSPESLPPAGDRTETGGEPSPSRREESSGSCCGEPRSQVELEPRVAEYVRAVTSMIEGRRVSRAEVLEMLERTRRQHSFARERRMDYVLRRLEEEPEKPP